MSGPEDRIIEATPVELAEPAQLAAPPTLAEPVVDAPLAPSAAAAGLSRPAGAVPVAQAQSSGAGALARVRSTGMAVLAEGVWRVQRLGAAGMVGLALLVGAAVLYVANTLPQGKEVAALKAQLTKLATLAQAGHGTGASQVALGGLPSRDETPDVLARIYQEARDAGVELPRGEYEYIGARDGVAAHYRMSFPVHASYPALRTFMDRTLVALPAVAVEGLKIERKNVADETVDAQLKLAVFVREGS